MPTRALPTNAMRFDLTVALLLAVASLAFGIFSQVSGMYVEPTLSGLPDWTALLGGPLLALPLALRRKYPVAIAVVIPAMYVLFSYTIGYEMQATQITLFLAVYTIGAWHHNRKVTFWVRLCVVTAMGAWLATTGLMMFLDPSILGMTLDAYIGWFGMQVGVNAVFFGAAWVFGNRAWMSALERQALEAAHARLRAQQQQLAEQAVDLERIRIARELHDVVAHHVSAMGVQAGAARRVMSRDPEQAEQSLRLVEGSAREAIDELRAMVTTLRSDGSTNAPLPTLAELDELIDHAAQNGQRVTLERIADLPPVSPAAELTLYRVAQEGLTNARKHAGEQASVIVRLRGVEDGIELEVSDSGRAGPQQYDGTGHGLIGMRERVQAVGGRIEHGPKTGGGWMVRAHVPGSSSTEHDRLEA
ncbi:sensor histidine kinase [uncultured Agrococcus sp.]|uniref:sensor histidine kinase n=1 Tax=uncultured Agrococcus sp. TaxID=382258 RepID=UPI0025DECFC0|nr:sensor histidine kinase [uncultured Agrococcus sp.]